MADDDPTAPAPSKGKHALRLRKAGLTYDQIAEQVGYTNRGSAHRAVLRELNGATLDQAPDLHHLDDQRLDQMLMAMYRKAVNGDGWAVDRVLRVIEMRSRPNPADAKPGPVAKATERDLARLPADQRDGSLAATARALARNVDTGVTPSACARELRALLAELLAPLAAPAAKPEPRGKGAAVADISSRIAARRNPSAG